MSFVTYHTQRFSKNIVHCGATATLEKIAGVKARLSNILGSWRNAVSKARRWLRFDPAPQCAHGFDV